MKPAVIIQARMGSTRLPRKTLAPIEGRPMLWHVVDRIRRAEHIGQVIIATTRKAEDDTLAEFASGHGLGLYRGDEQDVLDRFYQAALSYEVETIVRVTPDCPLHDPRVIDKVVSEYLSGTYDYAGNVFTYTYPEGLDVEVFSCKALEQAWKEARKSSEREHVTPFIRNQPQRFMLKDVRGPYDCGDLHWSVDEPADLEFVRAVYAKLYQSGEIFGVDQVLTLLKSEPAIGRINAAIEINAGYAKSLAEDTKTMDQSLKLNRSMEYLSRAEAVIPGSSQTFSKGWTQFSRGVNPVFVEKGNGCLLTDVDGNRYIDYSMALCPVILGYNHPVVNQAITEQLAKGISFSLPHRLELELAEELVRLIPCAEMVRFAKNGSDATSGCVRVARAFTGREQVIACGFHGWQDWYIGTTTRSAGVPKSVRDLTHTVPYNDLSAIEGMLEMHRGQVAAIVMEPVGVVPPAQGYLEGVQELTRRHGALLIFDEIITGFRMHLGGAQAYFGVTPDLAAFGKAMGNGMPIAAVVGRREVMERFTEIFFSTTFGGETLSLAASLATIRYMEAHDVLATIWRLGAHLMEETEQLINACNLQGVLSIQGYPVRAVINCLGGKAGDPWVLRSYLQQECAVRGLLFSGTHNTSLAHTEDVIARTLEIYREVFSILADAVEEKADLKLRLRGAIVEPVFRKA